jgi:hypothetical protein
MTQKICCKEERFLVSLQAKVVWDPKPANPLNNGGIGTF